MSTFGPKGPTDPSATMAKVLQFRRPQQVDTAEVQADGVGVKGSEGVGQSAGVQGSDDLKKSQGGQDLQHN